MRERVLCRTVPTVGDEIEIWTGGRCRRTGTVLAVDLDGTRYSPKVWYRVLKDEDGVWRPGDVSWGYWNKPVETVRYRVRYIEEGE